MKLLRREIKLPRKIYWTACDNKNADGETNLNLIKGVPAGTSGVLIPQYQIPSLRTEGRVMQVWEFRPNDVKYRAYGGGCFMTLDDNLYDEFMSITPLDMDTHEMQKRNLELEGVD